MLESLWDYEPNKIINFLIYEITLSIDEKWLFMHLIATYLFFFSDYAFKTSEKVPSPFLLISLYSEKLKLDSTMHFVTGINIYIYIF